MCWYKVCECCLALHYLPKASKSPLLERCNEMTIQPLAYNRAARAAIRMWQKRDQVIETGLDTRRIDHSLIEEMEYAAVILLQLSETLYENWQRRGGQSNDGGSYSLPNLDAIDAALNRLDWDSIEYKQS